jgi:hypothetical protein
VIAASFQKAAASADVAADPLRRLLVLLKKSRLSIVGFIRSLPV